MTDAPIRMDNWQCTAKMTIPTIPKAGHGSELSTDCVLGSNSPIGVMFFFWDLSSITGYHRTTFPRIQGDFGQMIVVHPSKIGCCARDAKMEHASYTGHQMHLLNKFSFTSGKTCHISLVSYVRVVGLPWIGPLFQPRLQRQSNEEMFSAFLKRTDGGFLVKIRVVPRDP